MQVAGVGTAHTRQLSWGKFAVVQQTTCTSLLLHQWQIASRIMSHSRYRDTAGNSAAQSCSEPHLRLLAVVAFSSLNFAPDFGSAVLSLLPEPVIATLTASQAALCIQTCCVRSKPSSSACAMCIGPLIMFHQDLLDCNRPS